eukprot:m.72252 g.72252  ORF g.72252 m.72252 type:complete len:449 (+) comp12327_c0_seq8:147-1493(+)
MANQGSFRDTTPGIRAAGKVIHQADEGGVLQALMCPSDDQVIGRRERRPQDPVLPLDVRFGKRNVTGGFSAQEAIQTPTSRLAEALASSQPKGRSKVSYTPQDEATVFGRKTQKIGGVADVFAGEGEQQDGPGHSFQDSLKVPIKPESGAQLARGYNTHFSSSTQFGKPTPTDPSGKLVRSTLVWREPEVDSTKVVSSAGRTRPRIDPTTTGPFGYVAPKDDSDVAAILQKDRKQQDHVLHLTDAAKRVRPVMMTTGFRAFKTLKERFDEADVDGSGALNRDELAKVLDSLVFPLDDDERERLFMACDTNGDGEVNYAEFMNVIDYSKPLPSDMEHLDYHETPDFVPQSASFGMSVTSRRPPRVKSLVDQANYGDGTTAGTLLAPSNLTLRSLDDTELDKPRSAAEVKRVYDAMGVVLSDEQFDVYWTQVADQDNMASVMAFRSALEA